MLRAIQPPSQPVPWNKGKLVGQKSPLKLKEVWAIRIRLQLAGRLRDLALFNLAIDSKLRGCDLVRLRLNDVEQGGRVMSRAIIMQQKTQRPVQFEITAQTRESIAEWRDAAHLSAATICSPAECAAHRTSRRDSMRGSLWVGFLTSGLTHRSTVPIRCGVPRRR